MWGIFLSIICKTLPIWSTLAEAKKFPVNLPSDTVKVGYFLFAPFIPGLLPVVEMIKVLVGSKFLIEVVLPLPLSPTIAINSAIIIQI